MPPEGACPLLFQVKGKQVQILEEEKRLKLEDDRVDVFGGVDTHRDVHVAAVLDTAGWVLASAPFQADATGYEQLGNWLGSHGRIVRVGIEGTGTPEQGRRVRIEYLAEDAPTTSTSLTGAGGRRAASPKQTGRRRPTAHQARCTTQGRLALRVRSHAGGGRSLEPALNQTERATRGYR